MFDNDFELLDDFSTTRNLKEISKETYSYSIKLYTEFHNKTFISLLKEAEQEEIKGIRWKYRQIKKRLISFRNFLTQNYKNNYSKSTFSRIVTIYKHYEIEIHNLPPISSKNTNETEPLSYRDLPDKKIIKNALKVSDSEMKAIILFMSSSGCARRETLNLTIKDLINATSDYHESNDIYEVIKLLKNRNDIVPTFKLKRQKTNKYYYTFCSPSAIKQIFKHLNNTKKEYAPTDNVFNLSVSQLTFKFQKINTKLKLGKFGNYNRFRSHMLRKFHASTLLNDGMSLTDINSMQGKSKSLTDEAYFFENPEQLKIRYIKHLNALEIHKKEMRHIKPPAQVKLEIENQQLKKRIKVLNQKIKELE